MHRSRVRYVAALGIAVALFYWRILLTRQFSLLTDSESVTQAYSWLTFWISRLKQHTLPLWDPYMFAGRSFAGEMQTAAFYPPHLLLAIAPLNRHGLLSPQIYHIYYAAAHLLAAVLMFALIREFGLGSFSALLGSLCFALGGFVGRTVWPHLLESSVWLPLAFLCLLRALRAERLRPCATYAAGAGLVLGMPILAGGLHVAMMEPIAIVSAAIFAAARERIWKRAGLAIAISLLVAFSAGAVQLLPSMEYSARSIRFLGATALPATEKIPYADMRDGLAANALAMFVFGPFHGFVGGGEVSDPYLGVLPLLLAAVGIWKFWAQPWVRYFTGLAAAAFLFSLGSFSFLHGVLYATVPFLWMAREPGRFIYLTDFALAVLAAFGAELVFTHASRNIDWSPLLRTLKWVGVVCGALLAAPALFAKIDLSPWTAFSLVLILAAWLLFRRAVLSGATRWTRALALGLILFDLNAFDWSARNKLEVARGGVDQLDRLVSCEKVAAFLRSRPQPFRVRVLADQPPNLGDAFGIPTTGGGAVTFPKSYLGFLSLGDRAWDLLNVRYVVRPATAAEPGAIYADANWKVYENPRAFPRAWLVHQAIVEPSAEKLLARMAAPDAAPDQVAFTREALELSLQSTTGAEDVRFAHYSANGFEVDATARGAGLLVVGELFYPGWTAAVNGRPAKIREVDGGLRGVVVPAGSSRIEFRYAPWTITAGAVLTFLAFAATLAMFVWPGCRRLDLPSEALTPLYPEAMPIETKQTEAGVAVVAVTGRLVLGKEIERLESAVSSLLSNGQKKIVFDLTALDYADSSGIGTFISCLTSIRKGGGELRMAGVNPRIQRLFELTGVKHLMSVYPTVAEAAAN